MEKGLAYKMPPYSRKSQTSLGVTAKPSRKQPMLNIYRMNKAKKSRSKSKSASQKSLHLSVGKSSRKSPIRQKQQPKRERSITPSSKLSATHRLSRRKNPQLYTYVQDIVSRTSNSPKKVRPTKTVLHTYYNSRLTKALNNPYSSDELTQLYRQHFLATHQLLHRFKDAKPIEEYTTKLVTLNKKGPLKKCLVLDLDETLIHCVEEGQPYDELITLMFPDGKRDTAAINIRPHCRHFLKLMAQHFEVVVFTASMDDYARAIVNFLDPHREWVSLLLSRENCIRTNQDTSLKDLRVLGRSLDQVVIVDNSVVSYLKQLDNGIPIIPFYHFKEDDQLLKLADFLLQVVHREQDVRKHIRKYFHYSEMLEEEDSQALYQKLFKHRN